MILYATTTTTNGRVSKAKRSINAAITIRNNKKMRLRYWNHQFALIDDSKINNVNGKFNFHNLQTSAHVDRYKRRRKSVATNLILSNA
jgi:hypothetical protein